MKSESLTKETWLSSVENIERVAPLIANILQKHNYEGKGKQDAEDFLTDMQLACAAMRYVAEFATDKCRFISVPEAGIPNESH